MEVTSNITFDSANRQLSPFSGLLMGSMTSYGIVISAVSLAYIGTKLTLVDCFKAMLSISACINFVCTIMIATGLIIFVKNGYIFQVSECRLIAYPFLTMWSTLNMINLVSILRYLMSYLASQTRIMSSCMLMNFVLISFVVNYGFFPALGIILEKWNFKSMVTMCMDEGHYPSKPLLPVLGVTFKLILLCIIGLACDISLYFFIKRRNNVANNGGADIVPWKSTNQPQGKEDLVIPLRASFVSLMLILISLPVFGVVLLMLTSAALDDLVLWSFISFNIFLSSSMPGIVIIFTVKHHQKKNQIAVELQPPPGLQFHDQSESNEAAAATSSF